MLARKFLCFSVKVNGTMKYHPSLAVLVVKIQKQTSEGIRKEGCS